MKTKKLLLSAVTALGLSFLSNAQICFNPAINYGSLTTPFGIYTNDFNNDGKKDLAITQNSPYLLSIYYGIGNGTFGSPTNISFSNAPAEIIGGDFNEDGKIDLATSGGVNNVWILLANSSGGFNSPISYYASLYPTSLCTGDYNNDGHLDLAVPNGNVANTISILLGTGTGSFGTATNFNVGTCPCGLSCVKNGDFNSDGKIDLAVANENSNNVSILLGVGNGNFNAAVNFSTASGPRSLVIGDFNSDSKLDIATSNYGSNNVSVLLGIGTGSFSPTINYSVGNNPEQIKLGDYNMDGKVDIITTNGTNNSLSILTGNGSGSFNSAISLSVSSGPYALCNGDFNNDGKVDLAVTNNNSSNFSILLNCNSVDIKENSNATMCSVYPNPASNKVTIKANEQIIGLPYVIYDNTGKVVSSDKLISENTVINIENLAAGIYMLRVGNDIKQSFKIIKE